MVGGDSHLSEVGWIWLASSEGVSINSLPGGAEEYRNDYLEEHARAWLYWCFESSFLVCFLNASYFPIYLVEAIFA